jgi:hypothetical protein
VLVEPPPEFPGDIVLEIVPDLGHEVGASFRR